MSFLVRMIQLNNWIDDNGSILPIDDVKADGITKDLKSDDNTMSLWEINSLDELREVAASLLTSRDSVHDLFIVAIPKDKLVGKIKFENNNCAETAYKKFKDRHYDLLDMNLGKIRILSELILESLKDDSNIYDFVFLDNKDFLNQLIASGEIVEEELKKKVKKALKEI